MSIILIFIILFVKSLGQSICAFSSPFLKAQAKIIIASYRFHF
ncbi:hypothetical protein RB22_11990 [Staphylococcus aureus]|nr:hypothetical protein RB22_11990 [Staphylococcus aureus]